MKNKLVFTILFYITGIILAYTEIISIKGLLIITLIGFIGLFLIINKLDNLIYYIIVICLSIIIGFFITKNNLNALSQNFYNESIEVEGIVTKKSIDSNQIVLKIKKIVHDQKMFDNINEKIILNIEEISDIKEGTTVKVKSKFLQPLSSTNRYVFNYKDYLIRNKVYGTMFVNEDDIQIISNENLIYYATDRIKIKVEYFIDKTINRNNSSILKSVIFGDTDYLDNNFLEDIRKTGIAHIFAVSGLHIGIFILVFNYIFKLIGINLKKSKLITVSLLWGYGFLVGFPVSILRALTIYSILSLGDILNRKNSPFNSISLAALILLIYNPLWIFDVGFQLSFATTLIIYIYIYYVSKNISNKFLNKILLIPFIQIGITPILAYYFNYISLFSILGNLLLVPLFSITLSISFIGILTSFLFYPIGSLILILSNIMLNIFNYILNIIFNIPILGIDIYSLQITFIFIYYALLLFSVYLFNLKRVDIYSKFIYMSLLIFFVQHIFVPVNFNNSLEVSFLDVGQGNASLLKYKDKVIMIDAGGDIYSSYNKGEEELPDYLIKRGAFKIDILFISHLHEDHYCSIEEIKENTKINNIYVNEINYQNFKNYNSNVGKLNSSNKIIIDKDLEIDVIWPEIGFSSLDENENSLVLLIKYKGTKILYTGDITERIEKNIINHIDDTVDILLVPHHGSITSSSTEFIDKLNPKDAVFSYGKNFYGIPSAEVLERYTNNDSNIYSTFKDGEIWFIIDKNGSYTTNIFNETEKKSINLISLLILEMFVFLFLIYFLEGDIKYEKLR